MVCENLLNFMTVTNSIINDLKNVPDEEFENLQKNENLMLEKICNEFEEEHGGLMVFIFTKLNFIKCKMIMKDYGDKIIQCRKENNFKNLMFEINFEDLSVRYKHRNDDLDLGYKWKIYKFLKKIKFVE